MRKIIQDSMGIPVEGVRTMCGPAFVQAWAALLGPDDCTGAEATVAAGRTGTELEAAIEHREAVTARIIPVFAIVRVPGDGIHVFGFKRLQSNMDGMRSAKMLKTVLRTRHSPRNNRLHHYKGAHKTGEVMSFWEGEIIHFTIVSNRHIGWVCNRGSCFCAFPCLPIFSSLKTISRTPRQSMGAMGTHSSRVLHMCKCGGSRNQETKNKSKIEKSKISWFLGLGLALGWLGLGLGSKKILISIFRERIN